MASVDQALNNHRQSLNDSGLLAQTALKALAVDAAALQPSPINPDWIIAGQPIARSLEQSRSKDRASSTAVWDCTAGQFRWYFGWDETVYILEGSVTVASADGSMRVLRQGDLAYFEAGSWAVWHVDNYVKKVAFMRRPFPLWLALFYRVWGKLFSKPVQKL